MGDRDANSSVRTGQYKLPEGNTMANGKDVTRTRIGVSEGAGDVTARQQAEEVLLKAGALQKAIFNSANFSSIATDAKGVIQIFNVGAERMLGYAAADVMNKITPADISDPRASNKKPDFKAGLLHFSLAANYFAGVIFAT
jgi:PAS domain-containing protein